MPHTAQAVAERRLVALFQTLSSASQCKSSTASLAAHRASRGWGASPPFCGLTNYPFGFKGRHCQGPKTNPFDPDLAASPRPSCTLVPAARVDRQAHVRLISVRGWVECAIEVAFRWLSTWTRQSSFYALTSFR